MGKNLLSSNMSSTCPHNMVNFGLLAAEIGLPVWGTAANFNGFRVLAALLHCSQVVSISQTLRRWTEDATYVRKGDHHVGHWPTFLVEFISDSTQNRSFTRRSSMKEFSKKNQSWESFRMLSSYLQTNVLMELAHRRHDLKKYSWDTVNQDMKRSGLFWQQNKWKW